MRREYPAMFHAQLDPAFTHDHYFANAPAWSGGGKPELCCTSYGEFVSRGGFTWDNHPEETWRPHLIESGHGIIQINHGKAIELGPGDLFIMRPGAFYHRAETKGKPWRYRWLMLEGSRVSEALAMAGLPVDRVFRRPGLVRKLEPFFSQTRKVLAGNHPEMPALCTLGWGWVHAVTAAAAPEMKQGMREAHPEGSRAGLAVAWLREHYQTGCTVENAAKAVGLSRSGLFRLFREHTGQTPKDYLDHLRAEHAAHLLRQGGYSIKEIAGRCGYSDAHHFTRAFARKMGKTPLLWAKTAP